MESLLSPTRMAAEVVVIATKADIANLSIVNAVDPECVNDLKIFLNYI